MKKEHSYHVRTTWTGNTGEGTKTYDAYERSHVISIHNKADLLASSDPAFRGDPKKHNPEELFVSSLSSCHMLWYLHLCALSGVQVVAYEDHATGTMSESGAKGGEFTSVILQPLVTVSSPDMIDKAMALHHEANKLCYIARSCNFPVKHVPKCISLQ